MKKIGSLANEKGSRLVLALDVSGENGVETLRRMSVRLSDHIVGVKIGMPFVLSTPLSLLKPVIEEQSEDLVFIADAKLADVSHVNALTSEVLFNAGFDAVISHGFIGCDGGLDGAKQVALRLNKGLLVLVSMSHPASVGIIDRALTEIVREALMVEPDGIVAPATRPEVVSRVRKMLPEGMLMLSPGVGAQGAPFGSAIRAGADYEIVGRTIYGSQDPPAAAAAAVEEQRRAREG